MQLAGSAWPVSDLRAYLSGVWRIDRSLLDQTQSICGRMLGQACFSPDGASLEYREEGELTFGRHRGRAEQNYRYGFPDGDGTASVLFADGRLFHALDLSTGHTIVTHPCPPDVYRGRFTVLSESRWTSSWRIKGPRKNQRILTHYMRIA